MGVGSEVYGALRAGRKAIGVELKATYYQQAIKNIRLTDDYKKNQAVFDYAVDETDFEEAFS
jgi:DNA modification methylase